MTNTYKYIAVAISMMISVACADYDSDVMHNDQVDEVIYDSEPIIDAGPAITDKQNGSRAEPTAIPTDADFALLPLSMKLTPQHYLGWESYNDVWVYNIGVTGLWDRFSWGSWYRARDPRQMSLVNKYVFPATDTFRCYSNFWGATCVNTRQEYRDVGCPRSLKLNDVPSQWRSQDLGGPLAQVGWFWTSVRSYNTWATFCSRVELPFAGVVITGAASNQVNCQYGPLPKDQPFLDCWLQKR
jgi:hypothetical protein